MKYLRCFYITTIFVLFLFFVALTFSGCAIITDTYKTHNDQTNKVLAEFDKKQNNMNSIASGSIDRKLMLALKRSKNRGNYYALVIGNDIYDENHWSKLTTAVSDAKAVTAVLQNEYGFDVYPLYNASKDAIQGSLKHFKEIFDAKPNNNDSLLIYYAGHGKEVSDPEKKFQEGYWIPIDAGGNQDSWISNTYIVKELKTINAKHILVVADSCFSGSLVNNVAPDEPISKSGPTRGSLDNFNPAKGGEDVAVSGDRGDEYVQDTLSRRSRSALTSGSSEYVADNCPGYVGKHSCFAISFIGALNSKSSQVLLQTPVLFQIIQNRVASTIRQLPTFSIVPGTGDQGGGFLFYRKSDLENIGM